MEECDGDGRTAAGPIGIVALPDFSFDLSIAATALALLLAATGWVAGVYMTQHPVLPELRKAAEAIMESALVQRLRARISAPGPRAGEAR